MTDVGSAVEPGPSDLGPWPERYLDADGTRVSSGTAVVVACGLLLLVVLVVVVVLVGTAPVVRGLLADGPS